MGPDWVGGRPIAVDVKVLVVESCWRVVPLCHLNGAGLVTHVDQVKSVRTAVCIVVVGYRIQLRVCQLVVDEDPVVVLRCLDVDDSGYFCVVG